MAAAPEPRTRVAINCTILISSPLPLDPLRGIIGECYLGLVIRSYEYTAPVFCLAPTEYSGGHLYLRTLFTRFFVLWRQGARSGSLLRTSFVLAV